MSTLLAWAHGAEQKKLSLVCWAKRELSLLILTFCILTFSIR